MVRWIALRVVAAAFSSLFVACGSSPDSKAPSDDTSTGRPGPNDSSTDGSGAESDGSSDENDTSASADDSSQATAASGCEGVTKMLCEKACACTGSGACVIDYSSATQEHLSLADCTNYYRAIICGDAAEATRFEKSTCATAVAKTKCSSEKAAVTFPMTCR